MKFDFTTIYDRRGRDAMAVDAVEKIPVFQPNEGFDAIPMWVADMNFATAPAVTEAIRKRLEHPLFGYFMTSDEYFDSIIRWQERRNGVTGLEKEHIGYENGVLGGLMSALAAVCARGDNVLVHSPTYIGFTRSIENGGYHVITSPLKPDRYGVQRMDFFDMETKIKRNDIRAVVFCSPHNPTGRVWEQEELEQEADTLSHAEEIKAGLYRVGQTLYSDEGGLLSGLKECLNTMLGLQRVYPVAGELAERMESTYIELKDISQEVSGKEDEIEFSPERLEEVNERLNLIYTLQQKHRVSTVGELLALTDEYAAKLSAITSSDEHIEELKARCDALYNKVKKQAAVLTKARTAAAREVEKQMAARLVPLGMPNVRFQVEIGARKEPGIHGADTVNFLFSANKNGALQSVSSVASGGEIARVMLSIKAMIAGAVKLPTIVFDEIDTGVSGEIADRMADIMQEMGEQDRQVISITHLPQIAARGRAHYKVYKQDNETETNSHIRRLTDDERVEEIAHMLSGAKLTEAALNNARALLEVSNSK